MRIMVWWGLSVVSQYWIWKVLQLGGVEVGQWVECGVADCLGACCGMECISTGMVDFTCKFTLMQLGCNI